MQDARRHHSSNYRTAHFVEHHIEVHLIGNFLIHLRHLRVAFFLPALMQLTQSVVFIVATINTAKCHTILILIYNNILNCALMEFLL